MGINRPRPDNLRIRFNLKQGADMGMRASVVIRLIGQTGQMAVECSLLFGLLLGAAVSVAQATRPAATVSVEDIAARMQVMNKEREVALLRYQSERTYSLQYEGLGGAREAQLVVDAEFVAPDQKHFTVVSESGSKVLCEKVLRKLVETEEEAAEKSTRTQIALNPENYDMHLVGIEQADGEPAYVLDVSPKVDNKLAYRGRVWVSKADYAIMRIAGEPAKNPSFWINHASFDSTYRRISGVWVLRRNTSTTHVRLGGEATLTIDYGNYGVLSAMPLTAVKVTAAASQQAAQ